MSLFLAMYLAQAAATASPPPAAPPPEDLRIVCRTLNGTGSRLNSQRVCLPKREWQRLWDNSREATASMQDQQSKQDPSAPR